MSYTKEAVADTTAAIPSRPTIEMREERVVTPYAGVNRSPKPQEATGQPNKSDGVAEEPAKPAESVTLSPQVAALARKEQKTRQYEQKLKAQQAELDAKAVKLAKLEALETKLAAKDYSGVEEMVPYDEYTQYLINKGVETTPEQKKLQELSQKLETVEKAHQDDVSKRFEAAVNERRTAVKSLVESNPEFLSIKKLKMEDAVVQHILDTWENDSQELSPEQAAKEVRDVLKEKAQVWASILDTAAPAGEEKKQLPPLKPGIKTLTNQMTTGDLKRPVKSFQHMSDSERWAEARRRAEEKLKART